MHKLTLNPATLQMATAQLTGTPEELQFFHAALMQSNTNPALYGAVPPADADPAVVAAAAPAAQGDWSRMVHPFVLAQIVVDLAERLGVPIPDNTFVYAENEWKPLHTIQPNPRPAAATPPAPPAPPSITHAQLASPAVQAAPAVLDAPPVQTPQARSPLENLLHDVTYPSAAAAAPAAAPAPAPAPAPAAAPAQPASEAVNASYPPVGDYGLPAPVMLAPKGKSPFDTDPSGKIPTSPPDRMTRDIVQLVEGLFAKPATEVIGRGKGSTQRLRAYLATLQLIDCALNSVPDGNCPVAYLRHQIAHLRFNAANTPAGPTMLAFENYLFKPAAAGEE